MLRFGKLKTGELFALSATKRHQIMVPRLVGEKGPSFMSKNKNNEVKKDRRLRILWSSNSPHSNSGYGTFTRDLLFRMRKDGWEVACNAFWGIQGYPLYLYGHDLIDNRFKDVKLKVYPVMADAWGTDGMLHHGKDFKANVTLCMQDVWPLDPGILQQLPHFIIATTNAGFNYLGLVLRLLSWIIVIIAVAGYYMYAYKTESQGMGWRFMSFGHPLIICPIVILFYRFLLRFILSKLTGLNDDSVLIKFKGIKTAARLINVSQTGTYINEQPMMRFELEYTDNKQHIHKSSLKKVIGLLELDITKQKEIEIFYLPENPTQIAFASDLNNIV